MTALNPVFTIKRQLTEGLRIHKQISKNDADVEALNLLKVADNLNLKEDYFNILMSFQVE